MTKITHIVLPDAGVPNYDVLYTRLPGQPEVKGDKDVIRHAAKRMSPGQIYVVPLPDTGGVTYVQLINKIDTRTEGFLQ